MLADYLLHLASNSREENIQVDDWIVELGAGTGLTSIVAAMVAGHVTSTGEKQIHTSSTKFYTPFFLDIDLGNILSLIETNYELNKNLTKGEVTVLELDFNKQYFTAELQTCLEKATIVIAADGKN